MLRVKLFSLLFLVVFASSGHAENFGRYIGTVQTEWLDNDARRMRLLAPFAYVDPNGITWTAPSGWVIDGASIPVFAWSVIGGPFNGRYRDASVIHDVACDQRAQPWEMVHEAFYWGMLASGVEPWRAKVMYAAVYHFGPRWPRVVTVSNLPKGQTRAAREEALSQADPGSNATIIRVKPHAAGQTTPGAPERSDVEVQIQPPPRKLKEQDFEQLKQRILEAEAPPAAAPPAPPTVAPGAPKPAPDSSAAEGRGTGGAGGAGGADGARSRGFYHRRQEAPAESGTSRGLAARPQGGGVSLSEIRAFEPNQ